MAKNGKKLLKKARKNPLVILIILGVIIGGGFLLFNQGTQQPNLPPVIDSDADGFPDTVDDCPSQPENYNGFEDDDGCPDTIPAVCDEGFRCKDINTVSYQNQDCSWANWETNCDTKCIQESTVGLGSAICKLGDNLPTFNLEGCVENAVIRYYNQFQFQDATISWITVKTDKDIYERGDMLWKYIGCTSVRESGLNFVSWGVTEDCIITSNDRLTDSEASSSNICGSDRVRG